MKQKSSGLWDKLTHAKANVWLVSIIVILFIGALVAINYSANLEGVASYAAFNRYTAQSQIVASSPNTTQNTNAVDPRLKLIPVPPQVAYSTATITKKIYLNAQFNNVTECVIKGPTDKTDGEGLAVASSSKNLPIASQDRIYVGDAPISSPNYYTFTLICKESSGTLVNSGPAIVTFFDPHNLPTANITAQEIDLNKNLTPTRPATGDSLTITEGNGVKLVRTCTNAQSGYITNGRGTILSPTSAQSRTTETLQIKHDEGGTGTTSNGIHSDHIYTVHCFSGVSQNRQEATDTISVIVQ